MSDETTNTAGSGTDAAPASPIDDFDVDPRSSTLGSGGGESRSTTATAATAGTEAAPPADSTTTTTSTPLPDYVSNALRSQRLPEIPGETVEDAWRRYESHMHGKSDRFYRERQEAESRERKIAEDMAALRESLRPILTDYYYRQREAETAQLAATIPDRETDPTGYNIWLTEQLMERDRLREEANAKAQQEAAQAAIAERQAAYYRSIDDYAAESVLTALGQIPGAEPDPDFVQAYDVMSKVAFSAARDYFPNATDEDLHEFVGLSQQLDYRRWVENQQDPREIIKKRHRDWMGLFNGSSQRSAQATSTTPALAPAAASTASPLPPMAARQQQASANAARREPLTTPAVGRPATAAPLPDHSAYETSEDYVEAALAGLLGSEEERVRTIRRTR